jgi:hypothetical protein
MSRQSQITAADIIPRHLRNGSSLPALTIPAGATAAEARRQLVLRTFASTSGNAARSATLLGLSEAEVRSEMTALIAGSNGAAHAPDAPRTSAKPKEAATKAAAKKPVKKGR